MTKQQLDINQQVKEIEKALESEKNLSSTMSGMIKMLISTVKLLSNQKGLTSRNSSKPPSTDQTGSNKKNVKPCNESEENTDVNKRKPGGQKGHKGSTLMQTKNPDEIEKVEVDRSTIPAGKYTIIGYEKRQVIDISIKKVITEYQAQILIDENGIRYMGEFPKGVTKAVQYGNALKAHAVYMSHYQLLPYDRIKEYFSDELNIPLSAASIYNFNKQAYNKLGSFFEIVKHKLNISKVVHADETGINVNGTLNWVHVNSNKYWTYLFPHKNRGYLAMDKMGVLPYFKGVLCHDHMKAYYKFIMCLHALCNAHHLRELTCSYEQYGMNWANEMLKLLLRIKKSVDDSGGVLNEKDSDSYTKEYRQLLIKADLECPAPNPKKRKKGQRGRLKRSKPRNLLERLMNYESDVLRFMKDIDVPFTNNQAENDLRMTKVQQKISGCFRSFEGAEIFCGNRSYIGTCKKQGISPSKALRSLFDDTYPEWVK